MFKKKLAFLLAVMLLLSAAGYGVCAAAGSKEISEEDFVLVTSFYPMYILAKNLTDGVEGIQVYNLTENQTGCLHDYQLTTGDMKLLSSADAFLINGAGMELFMDKVLTQEKDLAIINASEGIELLEGVVHDHSHAEEVLEADAGHEDHVAEEEREEKESGHVHAENGHVWMDPERYLQQVNNVTEQLVRLLPAEQAFKVVQAATLYSVHIKTLNSTCAEAKAVTEGAYVVSFHEGFQYLAECFGMEVIATLSLDEETTPSAGEIAEVIEEIKHHGQALIFIEEVYASHAEKIVAETGATVVYLDPLTTGDGALRSYLDGMRININEIRKVFGIGAYEPE